MATSSDGRNEAQRFCEAVGQLLLAFAGVENQLQALLKLHLMQQITTDPDDSKVVGMVAAIYGSMRFSASRDTMKRIMAVENTPNEHAVFAKDLFDHLGNIQSLRDMLAHQALEMPDGDGPWTLHDVFTTRDTSKPKTFALRTDDLTLAGYDLFAACDRIGGFEAEGTLFSGGDTSLVSWLYKPSMLKFLPKNRVPRSR